VQCVVRHIGRHAFSGHYITDVRTREPPSGLGAQEPKVTWKRYDDSVVSKVSQGPTWSNHIYIIYIRDIHYIYIFIYINMYVYTYIYIIYSITSLAAALS
jgi:hypothetical protein